MTPSPTDDAVAVGRRDRKKNATRDALRASAHALFAERGFQATTIDDITEAADVSRRTFFRYFDSKDDLLRVDVADLLPVMVAALRARPLDEAPLTSILAALRVLVGPDGPPALATSLAGPATGIRARIVLFRLLAQWEEGIADTLLSRWGAVPGLSTETLRHQATVTAAAATSALRSSVQVYRSRYGGTDLHTGRILAVIEESFAVLGAGCPSPHAR